MILTVKENEYRLRLLCGKFRELKDKIKTENLMESIMTAMQNSDVDTMAKAIAEQMTAALNGVDFTEIAQKSPAERFTGFKA